MHGHRALASRPGAGLAAGTVGLVIATMRATRSALALLAGQAHRIVLGLAVLVTGLVLVSLAAAALDDAAIGSATRTTTAEVIAVSPGRAIVRFATPNGEIHVPAEGVAYPAGLEKGQRVRVAYAADNPDLVRVAGRSWTTAVVPAVVAITVTWLVAGLVIWRLRRAGRHP